MEHDIVHIYVQTQSIELGAPPRCCVTHTQHRAVCQRKKSMHLSHNIQCCILIVNGSHYNRTGFWVRTEPCRTTSNCTLKFSQYYYKVSHKYITHLEDRRLDVKTIFIPRMSRARGVPRDVSAREWQWDEYKVLDAIAVLHTLGYSRHLRVVGGISIWL